MLRWHRAVAIFALPLLLYVVVTGAGIQTWDMIALVGHAAATNQNMLMMRQDIEGPPNYAVVSAPDYAAPALPHGLDEVAAISRAASLGRAAAPGTALRLVELRVVAGRFAAHVQMGERQMIFDLATGRPLPDTDLPPPQPGIFATSPRSDFKFFHRFGFVGPLGTGFSFLASLLLSAMIITGITHYLRVWRARARASRRAPFWSGGSRWRQLHRWISVSAIVLVGWIALTGFALAFDNFEPMAVALLTGARVGLPKSPNGFSGDLSSPMTDAELPSMTRVTLASYAHLVPHKGIKVLRMRYFSSYPQGVVVAADAGTDQYVFNARTGDRMSMSEPGYPQLLFPLGWEWHQRLKKMHRGDFFGMTGRWLDSLGAIALLYLLVSGLVMYAKLWRRRAKAGKRAPIWM